MNLRLDKCIGLVLLCSTLSGTLSCAKEPSTRPSVNKRQVSGAALFKEQCDVCHSNGKTGGCLGPVLAGEGKRRGRAFIESRISNAPREIAKFESVYGQPELMPHPRVSPQMAKTLASYVSTLPAVPLKVSGHAPAASGGLDIASAGETTDAERAQGQKLIYEKSCLACHTFHGLGGDLAPTFDGLGSRMTAKEISKKITNAQMLVGPDSAEYNERGIVMPPSGLLGSQIKCVTGFLSSLK